jgi:hypothetical protein
MVLFFWKTAKQNVTKLDSDDIWEEAIEICTKTNCPQ